LLITVAGLKTNTWYLLAVGSIGMVQNIVVAGASREPHAFGVHLKPVGQHLHYKVMEALKAVEDDQPGVGLSLLPTFFPGKLREDEISWWDTAREKAALEWKKKKAERKKARHEIAEKEKNKADASELLDDDDLVRDGRGIVKRLREAFQYKKESLARRGQDKVVTPAKSETDDETVVTKAAR